MLEARGVLFLTQRVRPVPFAAVTLFTCLVFCFVGTADTLSASHTASPLASSSLTVSRSSSSEPTVSRSATQSRDDSSATKTNSATSRSLSFNVTVSGSASPDRPTWTATDSVDATTSRSTTPERPTVSVSASTSQSFSSSRDDSSATKTNSATSRSLSFNVTVSGSASPDRPTWTPTDSVNATTSRSTTPERPTFSATRTLTSEQSNTVVSATPSATQLLSYTMSKTATTTVTPPPTPSPTPSSQLSRTESLSSAPSVSHTVSKNARSASSSSSITTVTPPPTPSKTSNYSGSDSVTSSDDPSLSQSRISPSQSQTSVSRSAATKSPTHSDTARTQSKPQSATDSPSATSSQTASVSMSLTGTLAPSFSKMVDISGTPSLSESESRTHTATLDASESATYSPNISMTGSATKSQSLMSTRSPTDLVSRSVTTSTSCSPSISHTSMETSTITATRHTLPDTVTVSDHRTVSASSSKTSTRSESKTSSRTLTRSFPTRTPSRSDSRTHQAFVDSVDVLSEVYGAAVAPSDVSDFMNIDRLTFASIGSIRVRFLFNTLLRNFYRNTSLNWFPMPVAENCIVNKAELMSAYDVVLTISYDPDVSLFVQVQEDYNCNITFSSDVFQCQALTNFSFNFSTAMTVSGTPQGFPSLMKIISSLATSGSAMLSGGGASLLTQSRAGSLAAFASCQFSLVQPLEVQDNPTQIGFGSYIHFYNRGAVIGNISFIIAMMVFMLLVLLALTFCLRKQVVVYECASAKTATATENNLNSMIIDKRDGVSGNVEATLLEEKDENTVTLDGLPLSLSLAPERQSDADVRVLEQRSETLGEAFIRLCSNTAYPSIGLVLLLWLVDSTTTASVRLLRYPFDAYDRYIGAVGLAVYTLLFVSSAFVCIVVVRRKESLVKIAGAEGLLTSPHPLARIIRWWMLPPYELVPLKKRQQRFYAMMAYLFSESRFAFFICIDLGLSLLMAILVGMAVSKPEVCFRYALIAVVGYSVFFVLLVVLRPQLTRFSLVLNIVTSMLGLTSSIMILVAMRTGSTKLILATQSLNVALLYVSSFQMISTVFGIVLWMHQNRVKHQRRRKHKQNFRKMYRQPNGSLVESGPDSSSEEDDEEEASLKNASSIVDLIKEVDDDDLTLVLCRGVGQDDLGAVASASRCATVEILEENSILDHIKEVGPTNELIHDVFLFDFIYELLVTSVVDRVTGVSDEAAANESGVMIGDAATPPTSLFTHDSTCVADKNDDDGMWELIKDFACLNEMDDQSHTHSQPKTMVNEEEEEEELKGQEKPFASLMKEDEMDVAVTALMSVSAACGAASREVGDSLMYLSGSDVALKMISPLSKDEYTIQNFDDAVKRSQAIGLDNAVRRHTVVSLPEEEDDDDL